MTSDTYTLNQKAKHQLPASIFDPKAILSITQLQKEGYDDILEQFIDLFLRSADRLMHDFKQGVEANNFRKIHYALHTLKSSSAHLGTSAFIDLCELIELAAFRNDAEAIAKYSKNLQIQFNEIEQLLVQYLTLQEQKERIEILT